MRLSPVLFSARSQFGNTTASDASVEQKDPPKEVETPKADDWFDGVDWLDLSRSSNSVPKFGHE